MTQKLDLTRLRAVAEAATPGPWSAEKYLYGVDDGRIRVTSPSDDEYNIAEDVTEADAVHIATFDPPTVLALLSRLEQAEQQVARVRAMAEEMGEAIGFDRLVHGSEAEYPVSYFRDKLEEALDGEQDG